MPPDIDFAIDSQTLMTALVSVGAFLVVYFFLLVRALVEMIRLDAPGVVIVFTYISLIFFCIGLIEFRLLPTVSPPIPNH